MRLRIGNKLMLFRVKVISLDGDNPRIGINSGEPKRGNHYLFLDYDGKDIDIYSHFEQIVRRHGLRRGIIMDSGNGYHCISFSPMPYPKMLEVVSKSECCRSFRHCIIDNGYATLRVSAKDGKEITRYSVICNKDGNNFYDFDREKEYLKLVEEMANGR